MKRILLAFCLLMPACADMSNPMPKTTDTFVGETQENTKSFRAKMADVIFPEVKHQYIVDPTPVVVVHPFCYKTWDKPVCYTHPIIGKEDQLVGGGPL